MPGVDCQVWTARCGLPHMCYCHMCGLPGMDCHICDTATCVDYQAWTATYVLLPRVDNQAWTATYVLLPHVWTASPPLHTPTGQHGPPLLVCCPHWYVCLLYCMTQLVSMTHPYWSAWLHWPACLILCLTPLVCRSPN